MHEGEAGWRYHEASNRVLEAEVLALFLDEILFEINIPISRHDEVFTGALCYLEGRHRTDQLVPSRVDLGNARVKVDGVEQNPSGEVEDLAELSVFQQGGRDADPDQNQLFPIIRVEVTIAFNLESSISLVLVEDYYARFLLLNNLPQFPGFVSKEI